jgi:hypothetical protein
LTLGENQALKLLQGAQTRLSAWNMGLTCGILLGGTLVLSGFLLVVLNRAYVTTDWERSVSVARKMTKEGHYDQALRFYDEAELAALRERNNQHVVETLEETAALFKEHPISKNTPYIQLSSDLKKSANESFDELKSAVMK